MKEEVQSDGGIEQHAAGPNNAEGRDMQHSMQDQEGDQGRVDIDKDNCQDRMNKTYPGHACYTESDHELITEHISE